MPLSSSASGPTDAISATLTPPATDTAAAMRVLTLSTTSFTLLFAVWLMFAVIGIPIQKELGLSDVQFIWLGSIAILSGSIWRLAFGILTDRIGGKAMFTGLLLFTAIPTYWVSQATSFTELMVLAALVGLAGNSFNVGISWNSAWFPKNRQGIALGTFGAGNVGASVTKLIGPTLIALVPAAGIAGGMIPGGWRFVPVLYTVLLIAMAAAAWFLSPTIDRKPGKSRPLMEMLRPLRETRVWRFSVYYVVVFGAYVALALALPKYYMSVYHLDLVVAAMLAALFIFPASLLRPLGGWMSDKYGARVVMYSVLALMSGAAGLLALPTRMLNLGVWGFTALVFLLGIGMGVGKAAVFKYIPEYFPKDVASVGGLVGLLGALGGFFLPLIFGYMKRLTGWTQTPFVVLFVLVAVSFLWLHVVVLGIKHKHAHAALRSEIVSA